MVLWHAGMKAMVLRQYGGPEVLRLEDVPDPRPQAGEVLVRVHAVSVNRQLDVAVRADGTRWQILLPHVLGIDPSGELVQLGAGIDHLRIGQRVVVLPNLWCGVCEFCQQGLEHACQRAKLIGIHTWGGYAELVRVPAHNVFTLPDALSYVDAAAAIAILPVAWHLLVDRAGVRPGETVLVLAAGGALGSVGVQIARLAGARVIAAAGADWKLDLARALGANAAVNYAKDRLSQKVLELTDGRGVDVVFENVSSPELWPESIASLAVRGRLVTCGTHGGGVVPFDIRAFYRRHLAILSAAGGPRHQIPVLLQMLADCRLKAVVHRTFPLEQVAEAHALVSSRELFGRVVLTI